MEEIISVDEFILKLQHGDNWGEFDVLIEDTDEPDILKITF
jgi:hypothetical protein